MADKKPAPDWEKIEADYRAGVKSLRQIADENGLTHGAINKRAKRDGWVRDLSAKIKAKAEALVSKHAVSSSVSTVTEREVVTANANLQASIQLEHRTDIQQKRSLVSKLFNELNEQTENKDLIEELKDALSKSDINWLTKLADKIASLPSRIKGAADLVNAYKSLIGLERQAFGIDDKASIGDDITEVTFRVVKP